MNNYETMIILEPTVSDAEAQKIVDGFKEELVSNGGTVSSCEVQKKILAHKVKGHQEGYMTLMNFSVPSQGVVKLEKKFKLTPQVLRYLLIKE